MMETKIADSRKEGGMAPRRAERVAHDREGGKSRDMASLTEIPPETYTGAALGSLLGPLGTVAGGVAGYLLAKKVSVNVTRLNGVGNSLGTDIATANRVFSQAGITIQTAKTETLSAADSSAILGADNKLDDFTSPALTTEEQSLVAHNRTAGRITAYYVPEFIHAGTRGEAMIPSYHGVTESSIVISSADRVNDTFAHEMGHVLLNDASHDNDASNLMASGDIRNFTDKLTKGQIKKAQGSKYVH